MEQNQWSYSCPLPSDEEQSLISMSHGAGGQLSRDLLDQVILPAFDNPVLRRKEDQAQLMLPSARCAFTTDSYVVNPIEFPGGDIGHLAVCGTINDLAVGGAKPLYLSASFIIEEGLPISLLSKIVRSMAECCYESGVSIVCGDTKVVERGKADKIFINTSGVGNLPEGVNLSSSHVQVGDHIIISGTLGDHGTSILACRSGFDFAGELKSDCAPLDSLCQLVMLTAPEGIRCMRDPTRGGLSASLFEIASDSRVSMEISERKIPVRREVKSLCELLGLDPLYIANEGKLLVLCDPNVSESLVHKMRSHPLGVHSQIIGKVCETAPGKVLVESITGVKRLLPQIAGEQLPRIC